MSTRVAVIGSGHLGRFHAQKFAQMDGCELVAVCDVNQSQADKLAEEVGSRAITDYRTLVGQVEAVTIATPTLTHFEVAKFFLDNKIHVNIEKPITSTVAEAKELCDLAESNGLVIQVGHVERFNPALIAAYEKLKTPLFIEVHRLAPFKPRGVDVDVVLDLMIHDLDVVLDLVKSPVKSVSAIGTPVLTKTVDIANVRVEFESKAIANLTASRVSLNAMRKFRVFQSDQYLSIDFGSGEVNLTTKTGEWIEGQEPPLDFESWNLEKGDALLAEDTAFIKAVEGKAPCQVTGRDAMKALELAEMIRADIKSRIS